MDRQTLAADVEAALVRALLGAWHNINGNYFRHALRPPILQLTENRSFLGRWRLAERSIEISRALVLEAEWGAVVEVLKHEVAHQYVHEAMAITDETAHGPAFREVCQRFGIDARTAGLPSAGGAGDEAARVLTRIAKLLALGASSNVHEAEAAMAAAQRLMLKYNIEAPPARDGYVFRHLGVPTGRIEESERILAQLLEQHFFVECIWVSVWRAAEGKRGTVLEVCGTPENVELAGYVHEFLSRTAERLWREYRKSRRLAGNRERRTYLAGVLAGFREKLVAGAAEAQREGLVWVGDPELNRDFRRRHPSIRMTRYSESPRTGAHADGRAAGKEIVLHRPVGGGARPGGRLLTGR